MPKSWFRNSYPSPQGSAQPAAENEISTGNIPVRNVDQDTASSSGESTRSSLSLASRPLSWLRKSLKRQGPEEELPSISENDHFTSPIPMATAEYDTGSVTSEASSVPSPLLPSSAVASLRGRIPDGVVMTNSYVVDNLSSQTIDSTTHAKEKLSEASTNPDDILSELLYTEDTSRCIAELRSVLKAHPSPSHTYAGWYGVVFFLSAMGIAMSKLSFYICIAANLNHAVQYPGPVAFILLLGLTALPAMLSKTESPDNASKVIIAVVSIVLVVITTLNVCSTTFYVVFGISSGAGTTIQILSGVALVLVLVPQIQTLISRPSIHRVLTVAFGLPATALLIADTTIVIPMMTIYLWHLVSWMTRGSGKKDDHAEKYAAQTKWYFFTEVLRFCTAMVLFFMLSYYYNSQEVLVYMVLGIGLTYGTAMLIALIISRGKIPCDVFRRHRKRKSIVRRAKLRTDSISDGGVQVGPGVAMGKSDMFEENHVCRVVTAYNEDASACDATLNSLAGGVRATLDWTKKFCKGDYFRDTTVILVDKAESDTARYIVSSLREKYENGAFVENDIKFVLRNPSKDSEMGEDMNNLTAVFQVGIFDQEDDTIELGQQLVVVISKPGGNKGKKHSLDVGFLSCFRTLRPKYVFFVDLETKFSSNSSLKMLSYMETNPTVGGACGQVEFTANSWHILLPWVLTQVFTFMVAHDTIKRIESAFGAVQCLPGAFSVVRMDAFASVFLEFTTPPTNHTELLAMKLADDRMLTALLLLKGWKTGYVGSAVVQAKAEVDFFKWIYQQVRWAKSGEAVSWMTIYDVMNRRHSKSRGCCHSIFSTVFRRALDVYKALFKCLEEGQNSEGETDSSEDDLKKPVPVNGNCV